MDARLEPYRVVVSFLGEALGPDYEVVLHDLTSEDGTIVAIVNNHISGRTEGAPLSNMALRFIQERMYEKQDYLAGYQGSSQAKGRLRSSTMFIKDNGQLIGMLCVNFDAGKYSRIAQELLALCGAHTEPSSTGIGVENFVSSLPDRLTMEEKIRIVESLNHAGIFYMKGAVSEVAAQLGSSEATIYRYLSKLKRAAKELFPDKKTVSVFKRGGGLLRIVYVPATGNSRLCRTGGSGVKGERVRAVKRQFILSIRLRRL